MLTLVTMGYCVEQMSRLELNKCADGFLQDICARTPLEQLATAEANPGLMLLAMASEERLASFVHYRSVCRLLAHTRSSTSVAEGA